MRISPQRHTLAVLRSISGLTQKEMASILECSTPTIQAVELGKLKLSEKLAGLVSHRTGISLAWLLDNNTRKPPIDNAGKSYTRESFDQAQASIHALKTDGILGNDAACLAASVNLKRLLALILRAYRNNAIAICAYKLAKTFDKLDKDFEVTEEDRRALDWETSLKIAVEGLHLAEAEIKAFPQKRNDPKINDGNRIQYAVGAGVIYAGFGRALFEETKKKKGVVQYPPPNNFIFTSPFAGYKQIPHADGQLHVLDPRKKKAQTTKRSV